MIHCFFVTHEDLVRLAIHSITYEPGLCSRPPVIVPAEGLSAAVRVDVFKPVIGPTIRMMIGRANPTRRWNRHDTKDTLVAQRRAGRIFKLNHYPSLVFTGNLISHGSAEEMDEETHEPNHTNDSECQSIGLIHRCGF